MRKYKLKPLIRWTIGNINKSDGILILKESIKQFKKFYPYCDFTICYNQISSVYLYFLDTPLYNQELYNNKELYTPKNETWKIYPPRLRLNSHELIIDNDLIITERIPEIDQFFNNDSTLLLRGSQRYYGKYDYLIPKNIFINSGIYGMPPNFDFEAKIMHICKWDEQKEWEQDRVKGLFDDQGIITTCLLDYKNTIIIENSNIYNYETKKPPIKAKGYHFIDANRKYHPGWQEFKISGLKKIYI